MHSICLAVIFLIHPPDDTGETYVKNCTKNVNDGRGTKCDRMVDVTHVSEGGDEALLVFHLQLVVLLVLPPTANVVKEGPDVCQLEGVKGKQT